MMTSKWKNSFYLYSIITDINFLSSCNPYFLSKNLECFIKILNISNCNTLFIRMNHLFVEMHPINTKIWKYEKRFCGIFYSKIYFKFKWGLLVISFYFNSKCEMCLTLSKLIMSKSLLNFEVSSVSSLVISFLHHISKNKFHKRHFFVSLVIHLAWWCHRSKTASMCT